MGFFDKAGKRFMRDIMVAFGSHPYRGKPPLLIGSPGDSPGMKNAINMANKKITFDYSGQRKGTWARGMSLFETLDNDPANVRNLIRDYNHKAKAYNTLMGKLAHHIQAVTDTGVAGRASKPMGPGFKGDYLAAAGSDTASTLMMVLAVDLQMAGKLLKQAMDNGAGQQNPIISEAFIHHVYDEKRRLEQLKKEALVIRAQITSARTTDSGPRTPAKDVSQKGIDFIASWEQGPKGGPALMPYDDANPKTPIGSKAKGFWTIGYGHKIMPGEDFSKGITTDQATDILRKDVGKAVRIITRLVKVPLDQYQFDALTSYVYNTGSLAKTKLLKNLNNKDYEGAVKQMDIVTSKKKEMPGLVKRRKAEWKIYNNHEYDTKH